MTDGLTGADYLLSLTLDTLWVADEVAATPVLIPRTPTDEDSLHQAVRLMQQREKTLARLDLERSSCRTSSPGSAPFRLRQRRSAPRRAAAERWRPEAANADGRGPQASARSRRGRSARS